MTETKRPRGRPRKVTLDSIEKPKVMRSDSWDNFVTGLGQKQDRTQYTKYAGATILDDGTILEMYLGDGLSSRIIDVQADDMTREWIWIDEEKPRKTIFNILETLNAEEAFNTAIKWQRLYGGSLMIIGAMDGRNTDMPLMPSRITDIEYLKVIDRTCVDLQNSMMELNPRSPMYGKIIKYNVRYYVRDTLVDTFIHHTRCIEFHNDPIPVGKYTYLNQDIRYWGCSSLQKIYESIRDLGGINQSTVNILFDFVSGVYKLKDLADLLAADTDGSAEKGLMKRMNAINMSKSVLNAVILDRDEMYDKQYTTLAGLPEVIDRFMLQLSGATGIPVTRLYGRSPAGLNATGESDLRNYYDLIEAAQRNRLMPPLRKLINIISEWQGIKANTLTITFNSLYQLTEEEKCKNNKLDAETAKIKADTEELYINLGLLDPVAVAKEHGFMMPEEDDIEEPTEE